MRRPQSRTERQDKGSARQDRPAAGGEALRAGPLQGFRSARSIQQREDRAGHEIGGHGRRRTQAGSQPAEGTAGSLSAGDTKNGRRVAAEEGEFCAGQSRYGAVPRQNRQLHGPEFRTYYNDYRKPNPAP